MKLLCIREIWHQSQISLTFCEQCIVVACSLPKFTLIHPFERRRRSKNPEYILMKPYLTGSFGCLTYDCCGLIFRAKDNLQEKCFGESIKKAHRKNKESKRWLLFALQRSTSTAGKTSDLQSLPVVHRILLEMSLSP